MRALRGPIDLTPLIDVVLLLLIFFILSSSFVLQPGVTIRSPAGLEGARGVTGARYILAVTGSKPTLIFFNDQMTTRERLSEQFRALAEREGDAVVVLKADRDVPHGTVMEILNKALGQGLRMVVAAQEGAGPVRVEQPAGEASE
ncbi:MAG: biopolymer transporter ExbD [Verrucomicrobiia bacterium]